MEQDEVELPTEEIIGDVLQRIRKWNSMEFISGEKIEFLWLKKLDGVEIKEIVILEKSKEYSGRLVNLLLPCWAFVLLSVLEIGSLQVSLDLYQ